MLEARKKAVMYTSLGLDKTGNTECRIGLQHSGGHVSSLSHLTCVSSAAAEGGSAAVGGFGRSDPLCRDGRYLSRSYEFGSDATVCLVRSIESNKVAMNKMCVLWCRKSVQTMRVWGKGPPGHDLQWGSRERAGLPA